MANIDTLLAIVVYRIWAINRDSIVFVGTSLRPIMLLVIESGAIYSATLTLLLILYKVQSWFQYVILDAVCSVSISFRALPDALYENYSDFSHRGWYRSVSDRNLSDILLI